ncbi:MAG: hydantoinase B/oxoprolinase family protein, partial [Balneolaceae bacterium]|nr:hydantoinase B/oxoprolinase family protein [Balneolaceae bacterium]
VSEVFCEAYEKRYGHTVDDTPVEIESMRVVVSTKPKLDDNDQVTQQNNSGWKILKEKEILFDGKKITTPVYRRVDAVPGVIINGPALILDPYSTLLVEPGWSVQVHEDGSLILQYMKSSEKKVSKGRPEAVEQELFTHRFTAIAEKMGEMLKRTALSVNIKERHDFSCALLNPKGELVVNAPHIPVHLGALGMCVRKLNESIDMQPGDMVITNHPAYGGSHLPDVTVVTPVFTSKEKLVGYVANRAHHAEIGGARPGSMPPHATSLAEEGVVIQPMYLARKDDSKLHKIRDHLLSGVHPTRNIEENMADLQAQVAANRQGAKALQNLAGRYGLSDVHHYMNKIKLQAKELMQDTIREIPNGIYKATEYLDDGTPLSATWTIMDESVAIDFTGTGPVHPYNLNANLAIVNSVVIYVLRVLVGQPIPLNEGLMEVVTLNLPTCLLNPDFSDKPEECPAVVGGNIEISQRLTDTLLKPFECIACGQGTMNNVLFGNDTFGYYETVGGGSGAGPGFNGADGVHQHMTNTRGTDPEIFEQRYPVRLDNYAIRKNSGGDGEYQGGDGIIREMTFLESAELSVLTQHRIETPYGQAGGEPGKTGSQWVMRKSGEKVVLEPADSCDMAPGDRFILKTPGGGGFGHKE